MKTQEIAKEEFETKIATFLKPFEGFSLERERDSGIAYLYYDSEGIPHIGYGFNLTEEANIRTIWEIKETNPLYSKLILFKFNQNTKQLSLKKGDFKEIDIQRMMLYSAQFQDGSVDFFPEIKIEKIIENIKELKGENYNLAKMSKQEKEELAKRLPIPTGNAEIEKITIKNSMLKKGKSILNALLQEQTKVDSNNQLSPQANYLTLEKNKAEEVLKTIITNTAKEIRDCKEGNKKKQALKPLLNTEEGVALFSLYYNTPKLIGKGLQSALKENNRFRAWFEIRYRSNGGKSKGIAKRRFAESNIFGLFDGIERGGFDNTADWSKKHTPTFQEAIEFMKFLYSPFRTEYDVKIEKNEQTKIIKKTTNNYIDYIKAYETEIVFDGITLNKCNDSGFENHYVSHTDFIEICTKVIVSTIVKTTESFLAKLFSVFSQPLFHPNTSTPNITATEGIKIALNPINKRLNQIRDDASLPNEAFFISTGLYTPKGSINNQGLVTHILLDTSSHFDCDSFTHPQNIIFYIILCNRFGENAKIIKLEGCPKALIEVKDFQIGMMGKKFNGLIQINKKEGVTYCFEKEADGKNSPNLTICDNFSSNPLVTIFNLRSEGNNNA